MKILIFLLLVLIEFKTNGVLYHSQEEISQQLNKHHQLTPGKTMEPLNCQYFSNNKKLQMRAFLQNTENGFLIPYAQQYFEQRCDVILTMININLVSKYFLSGQRALQIFHSIKENNEIIQKFIEGQHIANHIPKLQQLICEQDSLTSLLKKFDQQNLFSINSAQFYPETFLIFDGTKLTDDGAQFMMKKSAENEYWLTKDSQGVGGRSITLHRSIIQIKRAINLYLTSNQRNQKSSRFRQYSLVQRYIDNPLLINGKQFFERVTAFVVCTSPLVVLFKPFNFFVNSQKFDLSFTKFNSTESNQHILNFGQQFFDPNFQKENIWTSQAFQNYLRVNCSHLNIPGQRDSDIEKEKEDIVEYVRRKQMESIAYTMEAAKQEIYREKGFFTILGVDFTYDDQLNPWLIKFNRVMNIPYQYDKDMDMVMRKLVQSTYDLVLKSNQNPGGVYEFWKGIKESQLFDWNLVINQAQNYSVLGEFQNENYKTREQNSDL